MTAANATFIGDEIAWFEEVLNERLRRHGEEDLKSAPLFESLRKPTSWSDSAETKQAPYARVVHEFAIEPAERLVLILALLPHVRPAALDPFLIENSSLGRRFTEFGGVIDPASGWFLPTGETAMFLLAGDDIEQRLRHRYLFHQAHWLYSEGVLLLDNPQHGEPSMSGKLQISPEYLERLLTGGSYDPPPTAIFPAKRITTRHEWNDLVLDHRTRDEVEDIVAWTRHREQLLVDWGLASRVKAGYRVLFHGPPGTGKTLTACLLGELTSLPVYRVDLSRVVSKYIGETEKNVARLFDHAEHQDWILFFDEADALFGKRTESHDSNDRAAKQQIAYLLQRIEEYPGISIMATNVPSQLDETFLRRFQSMIDFGMPNADQRCRLWHDNFSDKPYRLADDVDLDAFADAYELAGGSIVNILQYACLQAITREPQVISSADLNVAVRRELLKAGEVIA